MSETGALLEIKEVLERIEKLLRRIAEAQREPE